MFTLGSLLSPKPHLRTLQTQACKWKKKTNLILTRVLILHVRMTSGKCSVTLFCIWMKNTEMTIFSWTHTLLLNRVKISVYSCVDSRPLVISVLGVLVHFLHLKRVLDISLNLYDDSFLIEYGMLRKWPKLLFLCDPEMRERLLFLLTRNSSLSFFLGHCGLWLYLMSFVEMTWIHTEALCPINLTLSTWVSFTNTCMTRLAKISIHY